MLWDDCEKGLRFRKDDKTEVFVAWDLLDPSLIPLFKGEVPYVASPFGDVNPSGDPDPKEQAEWDRLQKIKDEIDTKEGEKLQAAENARVAEAQAKWDKLTPAEKEAKTLAAEADQTLSDEVKEVNGITRNNMRGKITFPTKTRIYGPNHSSEMSGTITSRDKKGISFRKYEDSEREIHIPWESIDPKAVPLLKGEVTFEEAYAAYKIEYAVMMQALRKKHAAEEAAGIAARQARNAEMEKIAKAEAVLKAEREKLTRIAGLSLVGMDPKTMQKAINEKTVEHIDAWLQTHYDWNDKNYVDAFGANYKTAVDSLKTLEMKDPKIDEKVTLRPEFKKIGASQLGEYDRDEIYRLLQFACRKAGYPMPTPEMFDTKNVDRGNWSNEPADVYGLKNYMKKTGKTITLQGLSFNNYDKLNNELLKDQIRKGRPCYVRAHDIRVTEGSGRMVWGIAVGFETKDGKTSLEIQLGTDAQQDANYEWIPEAYLSEAKTLWVE